MTNPDTNPVGYLQEFVQKFNTAPFPKYEEKGFIGPSHARMFDCKCTFDGFEVTASATAKKQAKTIAAKKMVELLQNNGYFAKYNCNINDKLSNVAALNESEDYCQLNGVKSSKNYIDLLNEYCQQETLQLPEYTELGNLGGNVLYSCQVGDNKTYGQAISKKSAKMEAAFEMCQILNLATYNISLLNEDTLVKEDANDEEASSVLNNAKLSKTSISILQEYCVSKKMPMPFYKELESHMNLFTISCSVGNISHIGRSSSKKSAKHNAASGVLEKIHRANLNGLEVQLPISPPKEFSSISNGSKMPNLYGSHSNSQNAKYLLNSSKNCIVSNLISNVTKLQRYCESINLEPTYVDGGEIDDLFLYECCLNDKKTYGQAISKELAKEVAAREMCKVLNLVINHENTANNEIKEELSKDLAWNNETTSLESSPNLNYVSKLQEYCASKNSPLPIYKEEDMYMNLFTISCEVKNIREIGRSSSKKSAKHMAAMRVYKQLPHTNSESRLGSVSVEDASKLLKEFKLDDANVTTP